MSSAGSFVRRSLPKGLAYRVGRSVCGYRRALQRRTCGFCEDRFERHEVVTDPFPLAACGGAMSQQQVKRMCNRAPEYPSHCSTMPDLRVRMERSLKLMREFWRGEGVERGEKDGRVLGECF